MIIFGQDFKELKIDFNKIDSVEYLKYKATYNNFIYIDQKIKTIPDSSFSLVVKNENKHFFCKNDYSDCYYYLGFIKELDSYIITNCDSESCGTYLLNKFTGETQFLSNPFDSESKAPLLSKDKTKLLVFASSVFDTESYISIFTRQNARENFNFEIGKEIKIKKFRINDIIWIDENTIAIKAFEKFGGVSSDKLLNVMYIKGKIKY